MRLSRAALHFSGVASDQNDACSDEVSLPPTVLKRLNGPPPRMLKKLEEGQVRAGDILIDLGCDGGFFGMALADLVAEGGRVIAVDMQAEMLEITRKLAAQRSKPGQ